MARTSEKNEQMRDTSKQKIRASALNQFAKKGLFAARIQDIATDAGIAQGLLYRYYSSKDEIYADIIEDAINKLNEASVYVSNLKASAKEKIEMTLTELFKTIETSESFRLTCRLISQAINSSAIPDRVQSILNEKREIPYQVFAEIMRQGQEEGTIIDGNADSLSVLFWSTVNGLAVYYSTRDFTVPLPDKKVVSAMFLKK